MSIAAALFRQAINHHDSTIHRLPPEILTAMASHLDDNESLVAATHVCHRWRSTFLSFPHLWSHVVFSNTQRALVFLERSRFIPVSVCLPGDDEPLPAVKESLKSIAGRLTRLEGGYRRSLDRFLTQPLPLLRDLGLFGSMDEPEKPSMQELPSVRSLTTHDLKHPPWLRVENLTNFRFELSLTLGIPPVFGRSLLKFLQSCPLLEVVHLCYGREVHDIEPTTRPETEMVSLPCLRSFTHDSPIDEVDMALFDRLSVPPTCDLAFTIVIGDETPRDRPWTHAFPTPHNLSYISDIKTVKVMAGFWNLYAPRPTFRAEFFNSKNARISFTFTQSTGYVNYFASINLLKFLKSSGIAHSVETLYLENLDTRAQTDLAGYLTNLKTLILGPLPYLRGEVDALKMARSISVLRQNLYGVPLETVTVISRYIDDLLQECRREIEELKSYVGSVELVAEK